MQELMGMTSCECYNMSQVYSVKLETAERVRIEKLEIFDEFEEWDLLQSHYCLALGKKFADSSVDKQVHIWI